MDHREGLLEGDPTRPPRRLPAWRTWLNEHTERHLRAPRPGRPNLRVVRWAGELAVAKDYLEAPALYRASVGRVLIGREARIYNHLRGCPGIPRVLDRPLPEVLILEYLPGRDLRHLAIGDVSSTMITQLDEILAAMHSRGVLHLDLGHDHTGDLGRETNLIWTADEQLFLVDLAGAVILRGRLGKPLFNVLALHDRLALIKLKNRFFPATIGAEDEAFLKSIPTWAWRLFGRLRKL